MTDAITVSDLVVHRGRAIVLKGLSCRAESGRITGLLGPSGSGKTTLIRAIVGVQMLRSGAVTVLGEPAGSRTLRDRIGYVSQSPSIYQDLTVLENARYFAAIAGARAGAARDAVDRVGLGEHAGHLVGNLSGGQRSRAVLMGLVYAVYDGTPAVGRILLIMLGIFPFVIMFLITGIAMLRERTSGTLERLMTTRTGKADLLFGYGIAFGGAAAAQAIVASACAYRLYGMTTAGSAGLVVVIAVLTSLLGVGLGLACSALADVGANTEPTSTFWIDLAVVGGCVLLGLVLAAATLRRRTR